MRFDLLFDAFSAIGPLWGVLSGLCSSSPQALPGIAREVGAPPAEIVAFINVHVIPMDTERVLSEQTVLVEGGRIIALGPSAKVQVPAGAVRIDGRSKYLIPGLGNMHPHGRLSDVELQTPRMKSWLFDELAIGVTTLRQIVGGDLNPQQLERHYKTAEAPIPRMYISPNIEGTDGVFPPSLRLDSAAAYVAAAKAAGYHHIGLKLSVEKLLARDPRMLPFVDSIIAAARRVGLPVADHSHFLPFDAVLALGATGGSVEHMTAYLSAYGLKRGFKLNSLQDSWDASLSDTDLRALAATAQRAGLWMTPSLRCSEGKAASPTHIKTLQRFVKVLQDGGVGLLLAGDDGWDVHDELTALVNAGLTPYQALVTGTRNVAAFYKLLDSTGTVAVGKRADLVLLSGNPLQDIRHTREPAGVMLAGRWLDRAALDRRLLASPKDWFRSALAMRSIVHPLAEEQRGKLRKYGTDLGTLADSLAEVQPKSPAYERGLRRLAEKLGVVRVMLTTPEQRELFDLQARVWLREQARQGYQVVIPGVALVS